MINCKHTGPCKLQHRVPYICIFFLQNSNSFTNNWKLKRDHFWNIEAPAKSPTAVSALFWRSFFRNMQKVQQFWKLRTNAEWFWLVTYFIKSPKCAASDSEMFKIKYTKYIHIYLYSYIFWSLIKINKTISQFAHRSLFW